MDYVIHYDICAIVLLALLAIPFYARRRFFDISARLFSALLITAMINVVLDFYYARPMETDVFTEFMRKSRESA